MRETQEGKGLNEQAIRIGFIDKKQTPRTMGIGASATGNNTPMADFESQF